MMLVCGSTLRFGSPYSSNQCVISAPAALTSGSTSCPGNLLINGVTSSTRPCTAGGTGAKCVTVTPSDTPRPAQR